MPQFTILRADRLFDGSGAPPLESAAVLIEGAQVRAIGRIAEVRQPDGAEVELHEYGDATILPGLVDVHTHMMGTGDGTLGDDLVRNNDDDMLLLRAAKNARHALTSGVTTARENGAKGRVAFSLKEGMRRGLVEGPRMVVSGRPLTVTGGHMGYCGSEADGVEGVRHEVRQLIKEGADFIKIMATGGSTRTSYALLPSYTVEELAVATDEAHRFGKLTAAHCANAQGVANALEAGIDMIIHCVFEDATGIYEWRQDLAEQLAAAKAWVNPTLHVARSGVWALEDDIERNGSTPAKLARLDALQRSLEHRMEVTGRLAKMGVGVTSGSDSPWSNYAPGLFVHEVELMGDAGLTNAEALVSATSDAAASIGMAEHAGLLAAGRQADVLVVDGNPLESLAALWQVRDVFQAGKRVERPVH
ncbi:MAG: amidohydrolase family protein [Dehalococcoidia bacterium]